MIKLILEEYRYNIRIIQNHALMFINRFIYRLGICEMKITKNTKDKIRMSITDILGKSGPMSRHDLTAAILARFSLTEKEMNDKRADGKYFIILSYIGTTINEMVNIRDIKREGNMYSLAKEELVIVKDSQCRAQIIRLLTKSPMNKREIFSTLEKTFGTDKTYSKRDDNELRSICGRIIVELIANGKIYLSDSGKYRINDTFTYPPSLITEDEFKDLFFERVHSMGGKFFEGFLTGLLEKYFTITGREVRFCETTGGSDDGGVDIIINTKDELGFCENIMVQAKCRAKIQVTEKEIREFYGAVNAKDGTRGIFVTTSTFHPNAKKLIDSITNLVGIDRQKLFELVKITEYGIHITRGMFSFDSTIFG